MLGPELHGWRWLGLELGLDHEKVNITEPDRRNIFDLAGKFVLPVMNFDLLVRYKL